MRTVRNTLPLFIIISLFIVNSINGKVPNRQSTYGKWELVWTEDFEMDTLDSSIWGKINRGRQPWNDTMSDSDECYQIENGVLTLFGIVNNIDDNDTSKYLTGGISTKDKKAFSKGRLEIKAKFTNARGAWPAIWLCPFKWEQGWPEDGEIDIMEHYFSDEYVFQTLHTHFTYDLKRNKPANRIKSPINSNDFNVYAVELHDDSVCFFVNNTKMLTYPKIDSLQSGLQFPFNREWYLLLDMQLGGIGAGKVFEEDLPVEMQIDWVKYYKSK